MYSIFASSQERPTTIAVGRYGADGQLAVGKNPIDEEEKDDTRDGRRNLQQPVRDKDKRDIINMAQEQDSQDRLLRRGDGDAQ